MVQYRDAQGQPESLLVDGGSHTVTIPGLSPSRRYNFYLYGVLGHERLGPISLDTITGEGRCWICPWHLWVQDLVCQRSWGWVCPGALGPGGTWGLLLGAEWGVDGAGRVGGMEG